MPSFPNPLHHGDTIAVIAPCSAAEPAKVRAGIKYLESKGYRIKKASNLSDNYGYLAGSDETRVKEFHRLWSDPEVKALFCVRGGYGVLRLLPHVDFNMIKNNPKIFVGYSDVSAIQMALAKKCNLVTFSGPMVAPDMSEKMDGLTEDSLWSAVTGGNLSLDTMPDIPLGVYRQGSASGMLLGGTLTVLLPLLNTSYLPSLEGSILVLEDLDENPGRIDRFFAQLKMHRVFDKISGLLLGQFTDCFPEKSKPPETLESILDSALAGYDFPVLTNYAYGHVSRRLTLPFGAQVVVETDPPSVRLI